MTALISNEEIMTRAIQLRKKLGEDGDSPVDIFALAQSIEGLTIVYYPMGENLSGMCIKAAAECNVIAINSAMTVGRQRFSLAHEFYHLYYDENMSAVCVKKIGAGNDIEKEADIFASYFLMPSAALRTRADELKLRNPDHRLTLKDIIRIQQYFGVSHHASVIRLKQEGLIRPGDAETLMTSGVRRLAESMGYGSDLYQPLPEEKRYMTYGHYIEQAEKVLDRNLVSVGKYEELLLSAFRPDIVYGGHEEGGGVID